MTYDIREIRVQEWLVSRSGNSFSVIENGETVWSGHVSQERMACDYVRRLNICPILARDLCDAIEDVCEDESAVDSWGNALVSVAALAGCCAAALGFVAWICWGSW